MADDFKTRTLAFFERIDLCLDALERIEEIRLASGFDRGKDDQATVDSINQTVKRIAAKLTTMSPEKSEGLWPAWNNIVQRCEKLGILGNREFN